MSGSIRGGADAPEQWDGAMQLLDAYQAGLREVVQVADQVDRQSGWACLERLADFLAGWFRRPDWYALWAFMTAADTTAIDDPEAARAVISYWQEERMLLNRLAKAAGTADPAGLGGRVWVIVHGSGIAAALDDGDNAADMLRGLLASERSRARGCGGHRSAL